MFTWSLATYLEAGDVEVHHDLSRIPPTARIVEIIIVPGGARRAAALGGADTVE